MTEPVGRPVGTTEGVQRGWPLPVRLVLLVAVVGAVGLWLLSVGGGGGDGETDGATPPGSDTTAVDESVGTPEPQTAGGGDDAGVSASGPGAGAGAGDGVEEEPPPTIPVEPDGEPVGRLVAGADACDTPASGPSIVVGVAADQAAEARGAETLEFVAARHLATLVNCVGGVAGRPLEIVAVDLAGSPLTTRQGIADLLDAEPVAIIGPRSAEIGLRVLEALDGRVAVVFPLTTEPALDDPERAGFLIGPDTAALARAAARFAGDQGWSTAATFSAPGPHLGLGPLVFAEAFQASGGTAALDLTYVAGRTDDFEDQVARLVGPLPQSAPAVIFTTMPAPQLALLQEQVTEAGVDAAVLTIDGRMPPDGRATLADGTLIVGRFPDDATPGVRWFEESARDSEGSGFEDPLAAARVADALLIVAAAVEQAGVEPAAIGASLADGLLLDGLSGVVGSGPPATDPSTIPVVELDRGRATLAVAVSP